jgi:hypothetical protein
MRKLHILHDARENTRRGPSPASSVPSRSGRPTGRKPWKWSVATATFLVLALPTAAAASGTAGFMRAGDMAVGRSSFPAVTLWSGQVLVASDNTAELFNPASETFSPAGTLTTNRGSGLTATLLQDGKVLLVGGQSGDSSQSNAELYDPASGTFTPTGSMSVPRSFHTGTLLPDGRVLIVGGHQFNFPNSALASAELYDPATGTFSTTGNMSVARQDQTATLLPDGSVLIAGGYDPNQTGLTSAEIYDPATGVFTPTGSMTFRRGNQTATLLSNGQILIAGGFTDFPGGSLASAELYDPTTGAFASTGDMTEARGAHTATSLSDGTVLIAGGFTAFPFLGTTLASAEIYDPNAGRFTPTASMHGARGRHAAASLPNGDVLVAGGIDQCCGGGLASAEVYSLSLVDTLPPRITTPGDITVVASGPEGAVVTYNVSVTDNIDDNPQLDCEPPSGSTFPIGTTKVTCTAVDSAGNTATASFTVTVLAPLDIGLSLNRSGTVNTRTGIASVGGSVTCNRATHVFISGELKQTIAERALVDGFFSADLDCSPPASSWLATVTPTTGRYIAGSANASASAFSCDQFFSCDFDQIARVITLRGVH